jgi:lipopolysaccharide transport system ATP-binding protein
MNDIAIRAVGLTKQYRVGARTQYAQRLSDLFSGHWRRGSGEEFRALDNVSFEIAHGEIVGIVGGNGAGKSTLLKILARVVRPSGGSAELHGRLASLLEVGTGFHPDLTGRENIYMSGSILGMTRAEIARKFDEIVAFAGVERFLDTPIKRYSSGMQTRLGFAVAAHLEAEIVLIDELLAVGDADFQKKCLGKMKEVAVGGRTVLFISHNMNSVQALCSRAIWLDKGCLRADSADVRHVTLEYLSADWYVSADKSSGRAEWINESEGTKEASVVLRAMRLLDANGSVIAKPVPNNIQLILEFDLYVHDLNPALFVGYGLYGEDGEPLWLSSQMDEVPDYWPVLRKGPLRLHSPLPRRLLNEARYRIEFLSGLHNTKWFSAPGARIAFLEFEVQGGLSDSPHWTAARKGSLAPVLPWHNHGNRLP